MFSVGYCYATGTVPGYRQSNVVRTVKEAKKIIQKALAGKRVAYTESEGKYRAYADGIPTGYIYFSVKVENWIVIDKNKTGIKGGKAVVGNGDLAEAKDRVRKLILNATHDKANLKLKFERTGDNVEVNRVINGSTYGTCFVLIKV